MAMTLPDYDVAILGGGPVGSALALALAQAAPHGRIVLLRKPHTSHPDPRTIALNHGSLTLLATLAAAPRAAADIHTIHVSQRGRLGRTLIRHDDFGVPVLGRVARYDAIQTALEGALAQRGVPVLTGSAAAVTAQNDDHVTLEHDGQRLHAAIAISADGAPRADVQRQYGQHAVLTTVHASQPRPGWAWERFTRDGPLALLPYPTLAPHGGACHAVVWCCAPAQAAALQALSEAAFARALTQAFGGRLGALRVSDARAIAPLALALRIQPVHGRCVVIGNAAQTLHPVAGQGLNLGLRDAVRLAIALTPWLAARRNDAARDPLPYLADFAQARRADRWLTAGLTDLLPRVFATGCLPLEHAGGLALLALDACASLRAPLARHLLQGLRG